MPDSLAPAAPDPRARAERDPRGRAEREQRAASDPAASVFVSASAGSGKTKLLTDRLLRLMLSGADPGRIQCLTFTKAAAAEMALRLQTRLGSWVTLPEAALDDALRALDVSPSDTTRQAARALFARVLDLPGGMRIGTIHAFCQSLLRRFPLQAALSPHFQLVDETEAHLALTEARETLLAQADTPTQTRLETLAGLTTAEGFGRLVATLGRHQPALEAANALGPDRLAATLRRLLGVTAPDDAALLRSAASGTDDARLRAMLGIAASQGSPGVQTHAGEMLGWLGLDAELRAEHWDAWLALLFTGEGKPRASGKFCNKKLADTHPKIIDAIEAEQQRITAIEDQRRALHVAAASAALITLSGPVLRDYETRKTRAGWLDYDDLIARTSALLIDPGAAWVLYKLDGGLDHLLLDEVQDTSDPQWRIAYALTDEFFAGIGARSDTPRSFFAVGDPKQSIYSFQGADPEAFDHWRTQLRDRAIAAGQDWREVPLDVSFRSTAPVLSLVDAVFADPQAARGVVEASTLRHHPNRAGQAGRVELWPLAPPPDDPAPEPWTVPDRNLGLSSAPQTLADTLADWIGGQTDGSVRLESADRPLHAGDILVLVRRRGQFDRALVRALKARGVPVAGLDRMRLTDQPAVQDLIALLDTLLLPDDDLTLACVLVSPLGGLSDDSLMQLAMGRSGRLWDALRDRHAEYADWAAAWQFLSALLARADYTDPHALLVEALGQGGGRARLFARLGPEAAEPVDELLAAALGYAADHPPGLQGFTHWLRQSGAEVKREAEGAEGAGTGQVRIMTVHGAKGLQAPLVILPDTTALPPDDGPIVWLPDPETGLRLPIWSPRRELRCAAVDDARRAGEARRLAEYNRLFYVALTRAEDRLLICGWQPRKGIDDGCWYRLAERGLAALPTTAAPFPAPANTAWEGAIVTHETAQTAPPATLPATAIDTHPVTLPGWAGRAPGWRPDKPPVEPPLPRPLAPSRPDAIRLGPVPRANSPLAVRDAQARFRRGQLIHTLLQHLPDLPPTGRADAIARLARHAGMADAQTRQAATEIDAVLAHPDLAPIFAAGSRAELPISGVVGGMVVNGIIDRLAVTPDAVWIADFKTNRDPPRSAEAAPVQYLRQMAAYRAVLAGIYPDRPVRCALIWTQGAVVMPLPAPLLDRHAPGAA